MKYRIIDAKIEVGGGIACGPVSGPVIGEIMIEDENGDITYRILAEVEGCPNYYEAEKSCIEGMVDFDDETFDYLDGCIEGISDYEEVFEEDHDDIESKIHRYLMYLVRADWDATEEFIKNTKGKNIDEIEIPNSDLEEDYLLDMEE